MEDTNSFYVSLPSDTASPEFLHSNKITHYRTRLAERLVFNASQWETTLSSFSYKNSWSNVRDGTFEVKKIHNTTGAITTFKPYVRVGRYDNLLDLIQEIKQVLATHEVDQKGTTLGDVINFYYEHISDKCYAIIRNTTGYSIKIKLNSNLCTLMGFEVEEELSSGYHKGKFTSDLNMGFTSMYVYCSMVEPRLVGAIRAPLLRTVPITSQKNEVHMTEFQHLHYIPVPAMDTDVITMDIRQDNGEPVAFEGGKVEATLHFRRIGYK